MKIEDEMRFQGLEQLISKHLSKFVQKISKISKIIKKEKISDNKIYYLTKIIKKEKISDNKIYYLTKITLKNKTKNIPLTGKHTDLKKQSQKKKITKNYKKSVLHLYI